MGSRLEKNSSQVRKRIENHTFQDEEGDEYEGSKFGGFTEYFRRKKIKLQNLDAQLRETSGDKSPIFKGVVAHVNGYTQPSLNDLHHLIVAYGGGFMQYLDGKTTVTHIIAANLTPKKVIEFRRYRIVKPAWVVDSIAAGKLLPWERYRVLDEGVKQGLIGFAEGKVVSQSNQQKRGYKDQMNASWYASQVKQVAEDIDDEHSAQISSTKTVLMNGYIQESYTSRPSNSSSDVVKKESTSTPASSHGESFELTSSLESALDKTGDEVVIDNLKKRDGPSQNAKYSALKERNSIAQVVPESIAKPAVISPVSQDPGSAVLEHIESLCVSGPTSTKTRSRSSDAESTTSQQPESTPAEELHQASKKPIESAYPSGKHTEVMTAEEHNAALLADPHIWRSTTANPDFLKQYYAESRLHHLSAWKADLKSKMQALASQKSPSQVQKGKLRPGARRYVMHVDFDSFFCAVSLKDAPAFADKPCVVAHGSGPGSEIASCNYPARAFGIKNGMWMKHALNLCKNIKVLPYDYPAYEEASRGFYEAILDVGGVVQSVSIDEALIDVSRIVLPAGGTNGHDIREGSIWREQEKADEIASTLRAKIKEKTGCAVSIGVGGNVLLAKVALRKAKPAGQHQIKPEDVLDFIGELTLPDLPGVAHSIAGKLEEIGVIYVKDVRSLTKERLTIILGPKTGEKIYEYARGIDKIEVGDQVIRKSVSAEVNWGIRLTSQPEAEEFVQKLCMELQRRLIDAGVKGRLLTMKIMRRAADAPMDPPKNLGHGKCDTFNKSVVLGVTTTSAEIIGKEAVSILRSYGFSPGELRGLGVQMQKLEPVKSQGPPDGSQRRINFGAPYATKRTSTLTKFSKNEIEDPIDDDSPVKPNDKLVHPTKIVAKANDTDGEAVKPLNIMGTQFIMPTQIDRAILSQLPVDIRTKLMVQRTGTGSGRQTSTERSPSPSPRKHAEPLHLPSQLDAEVFDGLPEDMKAEVLLSYPSRAVALKGQSVLPQSPRKIRTVVLSNKPLTPTKPRGRGRPPGAKNKIQSYDSSTGLMQSNFLADKLIAAKACTLESDGGQSDSEHDAELNAELDLEFLSALPGDVRAEVVAEHQRARLARKSELVVSIPTNRHRPDMQRKLQLPARPPRPTFTTMNLSSLPELREALKQWHDEFKDEGPHADDVGAMERYLRRVILDEKNLDKVISVVKWLDWIINDEPGDETGKRAWHSALDGIQIKIQEAVSERGLGRLDL